MTFAFLFRVTVYNIRLGRNVKCACDDCCGLSNLVKRFETEGRSKEALAATKALKQHKKRADWKQTRYRTKRSNAKASFVAGLFRSTTRTFPPKPTPIKSNIFPRDDINMSKILPLQDECDTPMAFTMREIQTSTYSKLLKEVKAHPHVKCRKDTEAMKIALTEHYIKEHGARRVRGIKRKSGFDLPSKKKCKPEM